MTAIEWRQRKRRVDVLGRRMAYVEAGEGPPIVFLHGNPASSYLWRDVLPHLEDAGRCLVPDLIGMGDSDKLPDAAGPERYSFDAHRRHLDAFLERTAGPEPLVLMGQEWGAALAFDWARRHPRRVRAIAYLEAIVRPLAWHEWPESTRTLYRRLRSASGEEIVLRGKAFVDTVLAGLVQRRLGEDELGEYSRPFREPGEDRRPVLAWMRQVPVQGEPLEMVQLLGQCAEYMAESPVPKLFVNAEPGYILRGTQREFCRGWREQQEVTVPGLHFVPEDSPDAIGKALAAFLRGL